VVGRASMAAWFLISISRISRVGSLHLIMLEEHVVQMKRVTKFGRK